ASVSVVITPVLDGLVEPPETVLLGVSAGAGYVAASAAPAVVTIYDGTAPLVSITGFSDDTGIAGDWLTKDQTLVLWGTAQPGNVVGLADGGVPIGTSVANLAGVWVFDYTGVSLAEGAHLFTAQLGAAVASALVVDITPPTVNVQV